MLSGSVDDDEDSSNNNNHNDSDSDSKSKSNSNDSTNDDDGGGDVLIPIWPQKPKKPYRICVIGIEARQPKEGILREVPQ